MKRERSVVLCLAAGLSIVAGSTTGCTSDPRAKGDTAGDRSASLEGICRLPLAPRRDAADPSAFARFGRASTLQIRSVATPSVTLCDPIRSTVTVTNPGSDPASDVRVVCELPDGMLSMDNQSRVSFGPVDLAPGRSQEFSFDAKAARDGSFTSTATVTAAGGLTETATAVTRVTTCSLAITHVARQGELIVGRPATFDITVSNQGDADAPNTVLEDQIPAGLSFLSATDGGQRMGNTVAWNLGTLPPGASKTVSVTLNGLQMGSFMNRAEVRASCCDPAAASAPLSYKGVAGIFLDVIESPDPVEVGAEVNYWIDLVNQGFGDDHDVDFRCKVPPQMKIVSVDASRAGNVAHTVDGQTIRFASIPVLAAKSRITIQVRAAVVAVGDAKFEVELDTRMLQSPLHEIEPTTIY